MTGRESRTGSLILKRYLMTKGHICNLTVLLSVVFSLHAQAPAKQNASTAASDEKESKYGEKTFAGLTLREIGPALTSGRIIDLAGDPKDGRVWYIATAGGGVWKTTNAGTTFVPAFDDQKSFPTGCDALSRHRRA